MSSSSPSHKTTKAETRSTSNPATANEDDGCKGCIHQTTTERSDGEAVVHDIEDLSSSASCSRKLRSHAWFQGATKDTFYHRSWMQNQGHPPEMLDGRPVIAIVNTWSGFTPCNGHFRELAQSVENGIRDRGGFPLQVPVFSTGESCLRPTAMLYRNLEAMDVEEALRANPVDGCVLLVGCDKTTPACLMGAASTDIPTIVVSGGPMLNGYHKGQRIGSGTTLWKLHADLKAGLISEQEFFRAETDDARSTGTCNTMGTASTMACMVEALGMSLSGNAAIPAVDARRKVLAFHSGQRIVQLVKENITPSQIMTRQAFENAIRTLAAIGGSTNAVIHLLAIAGRVKGGIPLELQDFDTLSRGVPTIVNLMPAGEYLMEEFYYAGGLPVVIKRLIDDSQGLFHGNEMTVTGGTHAANVQAVECYNNDVIRSMDNSCTKALLPHIAVLHGNLAPKGAVMKLSSASPDLLQHTGKAVVFENIDDYKSRIDDDDLEVDASSILVLKNCGLKGYPGMAEVGNMALPSKLLKLGIRDMIRISDARMSGTAFGTVVLHVSPEAAVEGSTLACVQTGDSITLDVANRLVTVNASEEELSKRKRDKVPQATNRPDVKVGGGYQGLFHNHIEGPEVGADFDFLKGCRGAPIPRDSH